MIASEPDRQGVEQPLPGPDDHQRASNVLQERDAPTRSEHAAGLRDRSAIVRDRAVASSRR